MRERIIMDRGKTRHFLKIFRIEFPDLLIQEISGIETHIKLNFDWEDFQIDLDLTEDNDVFVSLND